MASSIPGARTNLVAALEALQGTGEALEGVAVIRSGSAKARPDRETITVLNARRIEREGMLSRGRRFQERYTIPVHVLVIQAGDDIQAAETRLWALVTIVEQTALASGTFDPTEIADVSPAGSDEGEQSGVFDDRKVFAELTLNVEFDARVTLTAA